MKPYVILFSTATIDGRIASKTGCSKLSCPYDLKRLHKLRAEVDAVMVGANTVIKDNPSLTVRYVKGKNPVRIVVDGKIRSPITSKVFNTNKASTIIITSSNASPNKILKLKEKKVEVIQVKSEGFKVNLKQALEALYMRGIMRILVEGGGFLNWNLIKEKLIDEIRITYAPYVLGNGVNVFQGEGFNTIEESPKLRLINLFKCECGNEVHVIYRVIRNEY